MMHTTDNGVSTIPTVRVVFDGPPFAGKTTAARALSEVLGGNVVTPDEDDGRTLWFDWLAYTAGHHSGQPVRVELVTVPGQQDLADRRQHLLGWGDVVVFVANTSEAVFNDSVAAFQSLRRELAQRPLTPVVVIANKRDLIDAVPMPDVVRQLGLTPSDSLIEGIAVNGGGIREAFVHAVHAALEQSERRVEATTADELLAELQTAVAEPRTEVEASETPLEEVPDASTHIDPMDEDTSADAALAEAAGAPAVAEEDEATTPFTVSMQAPRLNPDAIADGDAIVILSDHWRMIVGVAQGMGPIPHTDDPAEAVVVAELAAWGLLEDAAGPAPAEPIMAEAAWTAGSPDGSTIRF